MKARLRSRPAATASWRESSRSESPIVGAANASPTPSEVSIVRRSGRSGSTSESRKDTATTTAAIRKTVCSESVNAAR